MNKYLFLIGFISVMGCNSQKQAGLKPTHYICITAFGAAQINIDDAHTKVQGTKILIEKEDSYVVLDRAMCVEVTAK